ncbi:hypothetical protein NPIL_109131 [Nephila pilipes]|uniref:Uncharacterized protein n=1 Tax=Nephila pilipes TaxID=299642 RepID=A0A8X6T052_NEPPI|nr:hypothetical protein NPIL_109131 [Nephila pilipes]
MSPIQKRRTKKNPYKLQSQINSYKNQTPAHFDSRPEPADPISWKQENQGRASLKIKIIHQFLRERKSRSRLLGGLQGIDQQRGKQKRFCFLGKSETLFFVLHRLSGVSDNGFEQRER